MLNVKNISTGEVKVVYRVHFNNANNVFTFEGVPSEKVLAKMEGIFTYDGNNDERGNAILTISPNWEKATKTNNANNEPKAKKAVKKSAKKVAKNDTTATGTTNEPEPKNEPKPEPKKKAAKVKTNKATAKVEKVATIDEPKTNNEPKNEPKNDTGANDDAKALLDILARIKGGNIDAEAVRELVRTTIDEMAANDTTGNVAKAVKVAKAKATAKNTKEVYCKDFDDIVKDVAEGFNVYFFGRAGSGKSHTAEQVARALGLDFYGQTTIQFAHDVRGYGDAGGNFQDTPFFKAFCYGGVYFQDEYDRSNPEAAIVLNSALANGWYDFPIVGRVTAHENFRFIAAGNTQMNGADEEYVTGQVMDASSRDRFATYYEIDYSHDVEMAIANNDAELVAFVEDVRRAIRETGILHVVSYRATKYMSARKDGNKENVLTRCTFKGLNVDEIRLIYGKLHNTSNVWACAMANVI